ncbi:DUF1853 family protein [Winogradskyella eckloniae]|uniref:DUF1853 family protein n=1 Tax=Winogradskyella eckloniae TaxID=1089306 RepID=UPI001565AB85|nr:DUF1853 family protein [Winogradskyella eckloniae]NRD20012.1 DUF1853 family protein [Winogradskyella eckloniae]
MDKSTILQFIGYNNTPSLFFENGFDEFKSIDLPTNKDKLPPNIDFTNQRLGKLVEEFVFYQLKQLPDINWLTENLQIQNGKQTIGEIDALFIKNKTPIHLEIVYKFYLYDTLKTYCNPLSYWIGPNRNDTLVYKLEKLKTKQFPLLYKNETEKELKKLNLNSDTIEQQLCFKAQLFVPYYDSEINAYPLNNKCISGIFCSIKNINIFNSLEFYIPNKLDWLIVPHIAVDWLTYSEAKHFIEEFTNQNKSPMVWLKYSNTKIEKCFITYW